MKQIRQLLYTLPLDPTFHTLPPFSRTRGSGGLFPHFSPLTGSSWAAGAICSSRNRRGNHTWHSASDGSHIADDSPVPSTSTLPIIPRNSCQFSCTEKPLLNRNYDEYRSDSHSKLAVLPIARP